MSVDITVAYLVNVPLENDYKHTFYFNSRQEQESYFLSKVDNDNNYAIHQLFSYVRKDDVMRIPVPYDEAIKYNYVMYKNSAYSSKWFYAFITEYTWKRDDVTEIKLETDVFQTWLLDYTVKSSFIEREHVDVDLVGENTVPENLEMGDHICKNYTQDDKLRLLYLVVGVTRDPAGNNIKGGNYNGIYSGVKYYALPLYSVNYEVINDFLSHYDSEGSGESIQCLFIAPKFLINDTADDKSVNYKSVTEFYTNNSVSYYEPTVKNKKLLTFPYRYLLVSNNNGGSAVYKYELFEKEVTDVGYRFNVAFRVAGALTPGCSIRMNPIKYNGVSEMEFNNEEGLNLGKYPICNWTSDVYTNWLTQNSVNIGLNIASGLGQIIGGTAVAVASGGLGMAVGGSQIIGGVGAITNQLTQIHQMSFTPPQSRGNVNCGDVITADTQNTFHFYDMCIKDEYIKIIDEYFTMFGYKTNRVKVPFKNHRERFWYTKTIDVNITGEIPIADLKKLREAYDRGITFWKDKTNFKDYSIDNNILN